MTPTIPSHVWQKEPHDCGVAAMAMLTDNTYETIQAVFKHLGIDQQRGRKKPYSSNFNDLIAVAKHLGLNLSKKKFQGWEQVHARCILKVMVSKNGNWHWVLGQYCRYPVNPAKSSVVCMEGVVVLDPCTDLAAYVFPPLNTYHQDIANYVPKGMMLVIT